MFGGIVKNTAKVTKALRRGGGLAVEVEKPGGWKIHAGESVSVNGVCSTVGKSGARIAFEYMPETLARSTLGGLEAGMIVNLEPSLRLADTLDGHLVTGHVDTTGTVRETVPEGNSAAFVIAVKEPRYMKFLAEKGSVAVDGVSLTVAAVGRDFFTVKIIPYTSAHTTFGGRRAGEAVNLEFDILAKYAARLLSEKI